MNKNLAFCIDEIMKETAPDYVGRSMFDFVWVWVANFTFRNKSYKLHTIYDPETEYRALVVTDERDTIINQINE